MLVWVILFDVGVAKHSRQETANLGAVLTRVRLHGAKVLLLLLSFCFCSFAVVLLFLLFYFCLFVCLFQSRLLVQILLRCSYSPPCAIAFINIHAHVKKFPILAVIPLLGHVELQQSLWEWVALLLGMITTHISRKGPMKY